MERHEARHSADDRSTRHEYQHDRLLGALRRRQGADHLSGNQNAAGRFRDQDGLQQAMMRVLRIAGLAVVLPMLFGAGGGAPVTLEIKDYVEFPITGKLDGTGQTDGMLARVNGLREEPGGA